MEAGFAEPWLLLGLPAAAALLYVLWRRSWGRR